MLTFPANASRVVGSGCFSTDASSNSSRPTKPTPSPRRDSRPAVEVIACSGGGATDASRAVGSPPALRCTAGALRRPNGPVLAMLGDQPAHTFAHFLAQAIQFQQSFPPCDLPLVVNLLHF